MTQEELIHIDRMVEQSVKRAIHGNFNIHAKKWLTVQEAEQYSGMKEATLRKLATHGELLVSNQGRGKVVVYDRQSIDAYYNRNSNNKLFRHKLK